MPRIPTKIDGQPGTLTIGTREVVFAGTEERRRPLSAMRSVHVKNAEEFLLKVRFDGEAIVLAFSSMHVRDLAKAMLVLAITPPERLEETATANDEDINRLKHTLEPIIPLRTLLEEIKKRTEKNENGRTAFTAPIKEAFSTAIHSQRPPATLYSADPVRAFSQPLIDAFISMNCSLTQFTNHLFSSFFYDPKNKKNVLDRILTERIRGFAVESDWASRINSHSFLEMEGAEEAAVGGVSVKHKPISFKVACPFFAVDETLGAVGETLEAVGETLGAVGETLGGVVGVEGVGETLHSLESLEKADQAVSPFVLPESCNFEPVLLDARPCVEFEVADLQLAREMCRAAYSGVLVEEARRYSSVFRQMIGERYGEEGAGLVERLDPLFYIRQREGRG